MPAYGDGFLQLNLQSRSLNEPRPRSSQAGEARATPTETGAGTVSETAKGKTNF